MTIPGPPGHPNTAVTSVQGIPGATPVTMALAATGSGFTFDGNGNLAVTAGVTPGTGGSVVDIAAEASLANIESATGLPGAVAWSGSGNGTLVGLLKALYAQLAGTVAVSVASLSLPTGASTSAKQPAFGVAGTPSVDVISVQGVTSGISLKTVASGGTPGDFSSSAPAVPLAGLVLLNTVPATVGRAGIEVQNQSAATIQLVLDDGAAGAGTVSSILLVGAGAGQQGGGWASNTFKGRVRLYGASGAQVSVRQE